MDQQGLYVIALAQAQPQHAEEVKSILLRLVEATRREAGCLSYELFCDSANPARMNTIEAWRDAAAFDTHMAAPHTTEALGALQGKLAGAPEIRVLTRIFHDVGSVGPSEAA